MAHVVTGKVVLGQSGGVAVEGVTVESTTTGYDEVSGSPATTRARTASDGRFLLVFSYQNVEAWTLTFTAHTGQVIDTLTPDPLGDHQDTFHDVGEVIAPWELGGLALTPRPAAAPVRPRIRGRVVDTSGRCSLHCLQVLVETRAEDETGYRPVAVARTDRTGQFFVDYPGLVRISAARARVPGVAEPLRLPVTNGRLAPEPLIVIDVAAAEDSHESAGCDCRSDGVPRLPNQEDLASASSTYSSDLGGGCVNFTTPNRAIEEFDFWTVVRTTQPAVREPSIGDDRRRSFEAAQVAWDATPEVFQAVSPAHGHLLHFRQTWYADGYSLGDLLYSLPLAPGQKKLISIVDWERTETATRGEDTTFSESYNGDVKRDRDVTEVINAALSEQSRGGSTSSVWGVGTGTGGAGNGSYQGFNFGALFGISGGFSRADSAAWQSSSRQFASTSMNSLRDRVVQSASAVRGVRSSVVATVGEGESVRAETTAVANHNRCHAMTIQYFEVLRHFQMRHDLVEVKECLFVPLPITPFTQDKALRWRDEIAPYLLRPELRGGLEALRRVATNWVHDPAPVARYADETVEEISGEFEIEFLAYPPPLPAVTEVGAVAAAVEQTAGAVIASLFFPPLGALTAAVSGAASAAVSAIKAQATENQRYQKFHRDYMPRWAARFVDELELGVILGDGSRATVDCDFSLASRYAADRRLLVAFRATSSGATRARIEHLTIEAQNGVPDAVRCLVRSLRATYSTATFGHRLAGESRLNDDLDGPRLVSAGTFPNISFSLDPTTAEPVRVRAPLDDWERRNPRDEDRRLADRLIAHLNAHSEYYHHAIWWSMDPNRRYMLLDGYLAPNGGGRSVAQVTENKLIGIVGNSLVLPVASGVRLDPMIRAAASGPEATEGDAEEVDERGLFAFYEPTTPVPPARVSLPTKGVFAEAVLGACNSCEKIDDSRFWRWEDHPLDEPPAIDPASTDSRTGATPEATPTTYPAPIVNVQNAPTAPNPTDVASIAALLGKPDAFRDLTGLAGTQANAAAAYKQNLETAMAFGKEASDLAKQAGMLAAKDRAFDSIDNAENSGGITSAEAHDLRLSALKKLVGDVGTGDADQTKKKLEVVAEARKSGAVDPVTADQVAGTVLEDMATSGKGVDLVGKAAARKIEQVPVSPDGSVEVTRAGEITKVAGRSNPTTPTPRTSPLPPLSPTTGGRSIGVDSLEVGDIIVSTTADRLSRAIRTATGSPVSHATIYVGNPDTIVESLAAGVVQHPVAQSLSDDTLAVVLRVPGLSTGQGQLVANYAMAQVGREYDVWGAFNAGVPSWTSALPLPFADRIIRRLDLGHADSRFFCSELVAEAYRACGRPLTPIPSSEVLPGGLTTLDLEYVGHLALSP